MGMKLAGSRPPRRGSRDSTQVHEPGEDPDQDAPWTPELNAGKLEEVRMKTNTAPHARRERLPRGGGSVLDDSENLRGIGAEIDLVRGRDGSGRGRNSTRGDSFRALSWDEALSIIGHLRQEGEGGSHGAGLPSPGIKFMHEVPDALRHIGCMWLPDGREDRRCGKPPSWTMGANLNLARVYCEMHGRLIELRRAQIRAVRKLRRRAMG
jgi:hypothetical protein